MNTADEAKLGSPVGATSGHRQVRNWALSVDQCWLQALQFSVYLTDLLSLLLRCNGFTRIQEAVVDQTSSRSLNSDCKSRDITLPTKVCLVKAMVFPVVVYGCESWTVKKAGHRRIDALELWCWRRLFRVPWTARRSNQSILKEISLGCSLERLMLKLKLQYFAHLMPTHWKRQ